MKYKAGKWLKSGQNMRTDHHLGLRVRLADNGEKPLVKETSEMRVLELNASHKQRGPSQNEKMEKLAFWTLALRIFLIRGFLLPSTFLFDFHHQIHLYQ